jgi:hypothetical protein
MCCYCILCAAIAYYVLLLRINVLLLRIMCCYCVLMCCYCILCAAIAYYVLLLCINVLLPIFAIPQASISIFGLDSSISRLGWEPSLHTADRRPQVVPQGFEQDEAPLLDENFRALLERQSVT